MPFWVAVLGILACGAVMGDGPTPVSSPDLVQSTSYFATQVSTGPFDNSDHDKVCAEQKSLWAGRLRGAELVSLDCKVSDETRIDQSRQLVSGLLTFTVRLSRPIHRVPLTIKVPQEMGYLNADVDQALEAGYSQWSGDQGYVLERWVSPGSDVFPESISGEVWIAR